MLVKGVDRFLPSTVLVQDPDLNLVRRMASGDEDALAALYTSHERRLYAFALRLTGDPDTSAEVLQDSLIAAWQGAHSFRGEGRVLTWLLGIVHHKALNAIRRKRLPQIGLDEAELAVDPHDQPDAQAAANERRSVLAAGLSQLSLEHRTVLELVFFQGLSLAETAQVCDCPLGTVKSRLNNAKGHLRRVLDRAGMRLEDLA